MPLHFRILLGILLGATLGWLASQFSGGPEFIRDWIKPVGDIFIRLLKLIAVPLIFVSLTKGISDLSDLSTLSRLGLRTIAWYLATTVFAVLLGLLLVNFFRPGSYVGADTVAALAEQLPTDSGPAAAPPAAAGPLDFFVRLVPQNLFEALSQNGSLLQVIFFTLFFSICLLSIPAAQREPVIKLVDALNAVLLKMVDAIIKISPFAVVALMAALFAEIPDAGILRALLSYALVLVLGMAILLMLYPLLTRVFAGMPVGRFVRGILPAQLVAFSTSSSMATLPVTMEVVEGNLGVESEVVSFVCPIGATVNMDATSLMQAIATVFVCQVLGHELAWNDQLIIVLTASMASIGAAGAPSAGIVMLVIVLESVGFPSERLPLALAMILAVDRPLDMCRTVVNITGDACVAVLVGKQRG
ncbi:dicarboxylate/amino acid:cation symporter [Neolewinella lacunae]|uniref:Dicarboxylate/amino acid:cation symporter n=1 Tax=Neolewinella lacunae TaxID=1517758 RepID=A0A923T9G1_9BACT|nr:dicarboxylate/amino acid:cation symporter [Neolewinella lacunae]MBC6995531.1 dicarboxylate/amino acid:cation symporter [Neolewinella lacunae]MDN3635119.1 dicarboxylate/amino acid:cation symporter [Neolewinella lacunae]